MKTSDVTLYKLANSTALLALIPTPARNRDGTPRKVYHFCQVLNGETKTMLHSTPEAAVAAAGCKLSEDKPFTLQTYLKENVES